MASPVTHRLLENDGLLELVLNKPKANIVDAEMIAAIGGALTSHSPSPSLKAVLLSAAGPNFSFGASVEEHLPQQFAGMLKSMHGLVLQMLEYPVPILVSVRGQCLGGGLEIATAGHLIFASPDARLGQPEIKLGVIAPAASCMLPAKIGQARADDLLLSGRSISAEDARSAGLINQLADDPNLAARNYFSDHLADLSGIAIRMATRAARGHFVSQVRERIAEVESLYMDELMQTRDAVEGLNAFMAKREPAWENR